LEPAGSFFAPSGPLSRAHPVYEHRPGQEEMARAVERVLGEGGTLMVEAGTGIGKTLAYLVPALRSGRRVIVSTGTRNLQDQIFNQDLPLLRERAGLEVSASLMKGRGNYLCRYRWNEFAREPMLEVLDERLWLPQIESWSRSTTTGDRAEIADLPDQLRMWRDVNARADTCTGARCPEYDSCWLTLMKRAAQDSSVVVVNHHLFFADLAVRTAYGAVLPDYDTVIFDEAHLLEETATLYFGVQVSSGQVEDLARDAESIAAKGGGPSRGGGGASALREAAREFFLPVRERLRDQRERRRFEPPERGGVDLTELAEELYLRLSELGGRSVPGAREGDTAEAVQRRAEDLESSLRHVLHRADPAFVYSMELRGRGNVVFAASPIDVSGLLRERLFDELHASVLTSATIAVEGRFEFFRTRLGLESAKTRIVESPFDHHEQAILYLPQQMPEPRERDFIPRAVEEIEALLEITRGRAFLLFTSFANMEQVRACLEESGRWRLLVQGEGSKVALVESFKTTAEAVLLGTTSFWHGVDVQGEALSLVVIDKLPFDVPSDPLVSARIDRIRHEGGNPFGEYQLPLAVLDLKQGLGRLLRSRRDRGILSVLDPRLTTRRYGRTFLKSLPPYPVVNEIEDCRKFFDGAGEG
jgi:ATP-dependent DNA helicase DinG